MYQQAVAILTLLWVLFPLLANERAALHEWQECDSCAVNRQSQGCEKSAFLSHVQRSHMEQIPYKERSSAYKAHLVYEQD